MSWVLLLIAAFIFILILHHFNWRAEPWPENSLRPPLFQAHRGYWKGGEQENTLAAFAAAGERGLTMVELDVRLAKGQVPVVFHDGDFRRLGPFRPEYKNRTLQDLTPEELWSWQAVPTLEDVLAEKRIPQNLNIELKSTAVWDATLEKAVAELVKKHNAENRVMFSSFNPFVIWRLSRYLPQVPRALLVSREREKRNHLFLRRMLFAPYVNVHALHLDQNYFSPQAVRHYKKRKIPVAVWTVNDPQRAEAYLQAGAMSVISDTLGGVFKSQES